MGETREIEGVGMEGRSYRVIEKTLVLTLNEIADHRGVLSGRVT